MGTMDNAIVKEKLLEGLSNLRVWRDTIQNVYEKENLWDLLESKEEDLEDEREPRVINEGPHKRRDFISTPAGGNSFEEGN